MSRLIWSGQRWLLCGFLCGLLAFSSACGPPPAPPICEGPDCPVCESGDRRKCFSGDPNNLRGLCKQGDQFCDGSGKWGPCEGEVKPTKEVCGDQLDNNCDGVVDDGCECRPGLSRECGFTTGICKPGKQTCQSDGKWTACIGEVKPQKEICDGNQDENCDGIIDEGCACTKGASRECGSSVGTCQPGTQTCDEVGKWSTCTGEVVPSMEICDQKDNDCNGQIDDMIACP